MRRYKHIIRSIGIELEGGLNRRELRRIERKYQFDERFDWGRDRSVYVENKDIPDIELRYWAPVERIDELYKFIRFVFRSGLKQNKTCGNHTHYAFHDINIWKALTFKEVYEYFVKRYVEVFNNHEIRDKYLARLNNQYCEAKWDRDYKTYRYRAINFCSIGKHNTLEIRILPHASDAEELINAIKLIISILVDTINFAKKYTYIETITLTLNDKDIVQRLNGKVI